MDYNNIYTYITLGLFVLSEILPFLPCSGNGFLHGIVDLGKKLILKNGNDNDSDDDIPTRNNSERIIELKKKLEEINTEIEKINDDEEIKSEDRFSQDDVDENTNIV
jgi:hypothetical protein